MDDLEGKRLPGLGCPPLMVGRNIPLSAGWKEKIFLHPHTLASTVQRNATAPPPLPGVELRQMFCQGCLGSYPPGWLCCSLPVSFTLIRIPLTYGALVLVVSSPSCRGV